MHMSNWDCEHLTGPGDVEAAHIVPRVKWGVEVYSDALSLCGYYARIFATHVSLHRASS